MGVSDIRNILAPHQYQDVGLRPEHVPPPLPEQFVGRGEKDIAAAAKAADKREKQMRAELSRVHDGHARKSALRDKLAAEVRMAELEERRAVEREAHGDGVTAKDVQAIRASLAALISEHAEADRSVAILAQRLAEMTDELAQYVQERNHLKAAEAVATLDSAMTKRAQHARGLFDELVKDLQEVRRLERVATEQYGAPPLQRHFGQHLPRALEMALAGGQQDAPESCWHIRPS